MSATDWTPTEYRRVSAMHHAYVWLEDGTWHARVIRSRDRLLIDEATCANPDDGFAFCNGVVAREES